MVQTWYLFPFQNFATSGANEYAMLGFMRYYTCALAFTTFPIQSGMPSIFVVEPIHIVAFDEANNLFEKVDGHLLGTLLGTWYIAFWKKVRGVCPISHPKCVSKIFPFFFT